ncbi:uncharacterized protein [Eleutherodactylus coqui]|uniref:uncharacterized protein isoform X2 n=1 Tax=Eleutherodactylus coqui TaxID=57060 RepID=UPI003461C801
MISLIGFLSLSALTATSSAISCRTCISMSSTCSGSSITCPDGFMCGSVYTQVLHEGERTEHLIRTCAPSSECNFTGTMSIPQERIALGISCCSTDNCTPTLPTGSASGAMRGCATKSFCDLGSQFYTAGGSTIKYTYTCTSGGISAHKVVLTPAIVCLLVLKLFL